MMVMAVEAEAEAALAELVATAVSADPQTRTTREELVAKRYPYNFMVAVLEPMAATMTRPRALEWALQVAVPSTYYHGSP